MISDLWRVEDEIDSLEMEVVALSESMSAVTTELLDSPIGFLIVQGMASSVEKFYTGCERALAFVARDIDKDPVDKDEGWHKAVLHRMLQPYGGVRPSVLSRDLYDTLDALRSFRHRERNMYGSAFDRERVIEFVKAIPGAFAMFKEAMERLSTHLDANCHQPPRP